MNAVPRRWFAHDPATPRVHSGPDPGSLWLECEVSHPPSSRKKTVLVLFTPDDVDALLLEFRAAAIRRRKNRQDGGPDGT